MGQKVHPFGFRLGFNKTWRSRWYSDRDYAKLLHEDLKLRQTLKKRFAHAGVSKIETERAANKLKIDIYTSRPGIIIGRKGTEVDKLKQEIQDRLAKAGVKVLEARVSHLAYAPEIAGVMLRRQQATAVIAARQKIVEGAVGMVELALEHLSRKQIVNLDEERKATMVSNLMVVLCSEQSTQPVVNAGTIY